MSRLPPNNPKPSKRQSPPRRRIMSRGLRPSIRQRKRRKLIRPSPGPKETPIHSGPNGRDTGVHRFKHASFTRCIGTGFIGKGGATSRHCEERSDEAIYSSFVALWIASRSLSSGAHSRDPLARNDGLAQIPLVYSETV